MPGSRHHQIIFHIVFTGIVSLAQASPGGCEEYSLELMVNENISQIDKEDSWPTPSE